MENEEGQVATQTEEATVVQPTADEIADWQAKAGVSSQNFERAKKAEEENKRLKLELEALQGQSVVLDDGDLSHKVAELEKQIVADKESRTLASIYDKFPVLADKKDEFESFRVDYPLEKLETAAKIFLTENDLLEKPRRKSLEKPGSGQRVIHDSGKTTAEDAAKLRTNNHKAYMKALRENKLQIAD